MGDFINELLEEDLVPLERLNELKLKENGGYLCYRGSEYVDEDYKTAKGHLLFYIKQQKDNLMMGILVPMNVIENDDHVKPYLFKIIKGIRLENRFYIECGISNSYLRHGYVGTFGFKDGAQTMEGRMIDHMDNEMEYILVKQENY